MNRILRLAASAAIGVGVLASAAPTFAHDRGDKQGATIVTIDNGTLGAIVGLGLTPSAIRPGVIAASGGVVTATFPITKMANGVIKHAGGIALASADGTKLALTRYTIAGTTLTARAALNGKRLGRIPLFDLSNVKTFSSGPCAVTADLRFTSAAAGALTAVFGAPDLTGVLFGSACVAPQAGHDHDTSEQGNHQGNHGK
jgi:hypothetical protein